jgi:hypothetical protein
MKKSLIALTAIASVGLMYAQAEAPVEVLPEETPQVADAIQAVTVQEMIDNYLAEKGWHGGRNEKDGRVFFVAQGTGVIEAPTSSNSYIESRSSAFSKAMLDAKKNMTEYLGLEIETAVAHAYAEGAAIQQPEDPNNADEKVIAMIAEEAAAEADKLEEEDKEVAIKKVLASDRFAKLMASTARAQIMGLQAICTFESVPVDEKGEIGVIAIWSPRLQEMAASMTTGAPVEGMKPKTSIANQISKDPAILLSTLGVQQKVDEHGNLILLAFGQAGATTKTKTAAKAAQSKAKAAATAMLRDFAGENVAVATAMLNAESVDIYEDETENYQNESAFAEIAVATADKMKIDGISVVKTWNAKHPSNGQMVYGCICAWSPKQAGLAVEMRKTIEAPKVAEQAPTEVAASKEEAAAQAEAANKATEKKKPAKVEATPYYKGGQSGDDEAF